MSTPLLKIATIVFTEEEARVTLNLFDAAVKSLGLNSVEAVFILSKKFHTASFKEVVLEGPTGNVRTIGCAEINGPPDGPGCRGPAGPV